MDFFIYNENLCLFWEAELGEWVRPENATKFTAIDAHTECQAIMKVNGLTTQLKVISVSEYLTQRGIK